MFHQHTTPGAALLAEGVVFPLNLADFHICEQTWQDDGIISVVIVSTTTDHVCPCCHHRTSTIHDRRPRRKRDVPSQWGKMELILIKRRFRCQNCQKVFTEGDHACGWRRRTTVRLRQAIGEAAFKHTLADVSSTFGVGSRFVQTCFRLVLHNELRKQGQTLDEESTLPTPRFLGIDEFARRKGHVYDTILCDLQHHQVLEVGEGRKLEAVCALLHRLERPEMVEAVSMDMSTTFRSAVQRCLPQAHIVVDHFHGVQHVMKVFQKALSACAKTLEGKVLLHRKQYLFLKAKENLNSKEQQERAQIGTKLPWLEQAWTLKEELREWYATATPQTAAEQLDQWMQRVQASSSILRKSMLTPFQNWRQEILAFFTYRISNGFVEGKNNRTKMMMRRSYGFKNRQHLRWRILAGNLR